MIPFRLRALASSALVLLAASCSNEPTDPVAKDGTSSGVDNPAISVTYTGATGVAARISGQLEVFAADQNPAVAPYPVFSQTISNSAVTNISGSSLKLVGQGLSKSGALSKRGGADSARFAFNIVVKTSNGAGGILMGLVYDSSKHVVRQYDKAIDGVLLQPKPLVRYEAKVAKDPVHGTDCRVFVPGSPYLATLVDSVFVLENVPQDLLPLRLIGSDGKIYPIPDSLNPIDSSRIYRPAVKPVGSLDTAHASDTIPAFSIFAPPPREAYIDVPNFLEAKLAGIAATDPRLSILWKALPDSTHHDSLGGIRPEPVAELVSPTALRTEVRFHGDGIFRFLITATVGTRVSMDSTVISVRRLPPPEPQVLHPAPAESLVIAKPFNVQWQMPGKGPYTIEASLNNGESWTPLAAHYVSKDGLQFFVWTPAAGLAASDRCLLRVSDEIDTAMHAETKEFFHLIH